MEVWECLKNGRKTFNSHITLNLPLNWDLISNLTKTVFSLTLTLWQDSGYYSCQADNKLGIIRSRNVQLKIPCKYNADTFCKYVLTADIISYLAATSVTLLNDRRYSVSTLTSDTVEVHWTLTADTVCLIETRPCTLQPLLEYCPLWNTRYFTLIIRQSLSWELAAQSTVLLQAWSSLYPGLEHCLIICNILNPGSMLNINVRFKTQCVSLEHSFRFLTRQAPLSQDPQSLLFQPPRPWPDHALLLRHFSILAQPYNHLEQTKGKIDQTIWVAVIAKSLIINYYYFSIPYLLQSPFFALEILESQNWILVGMFNQCFIEYFHWINIT